MAQFEDMEVRFERLKQMYFRAKRPEYDDDTGEEMPSCISRAQVVAMFENMGVEIPMSPSEKMKPIPGRRG